MLYIHYNAPKVHLIEHPHWVVCSGYYSVSSFVRVAPWLAEISLCVSSYMAFIGFGLALGWAFTCTCCSASASSSPITSTGRVKIFFINKLSVHVCLPIPLDALPLASVFATIFLRIYHIGVVVTLLHLRLKTIMSFIFLLRHF